MKVKIVKSFSLRQDAISRHRKRIESFQGFKRVERDIARDKMHGKE